MALTQISTAGVKDDAVTAGKIPANAVGSSELADNAVDNAAVASNAAIAGTKISPNFGSQNIITTGTCGIGTTAVDGNKLAVLSGADGVGIYRDYTGSGGAGVILNFGRKNSGGSLTKAASITGVGSDNSGTAGELRFNTVASGSSAERMRIASDGKVGINTTNPATQFVVMGSGDPTIRIQETASGVGKRLDLGVTDSGAKGFIGANQSAGNLEFQTVGSPRMNITSTGNVGIGTTSPGRQLEVNSNTSNTFIRIKSSDTGNAGFEFGDQSDTVQGAIYQNSSDNSLIFNGYNNATRMVIDASGRLFLGTTPQGRLCRMHISGDNFPSVSAGGSQVPLIVSNQDEDYGLQIGTFSSGNGFLQATRNDGVSSIYDIELQPAGGNVKIGNGNLVVANGRGIDFSLTGNSSGTTASELLDDFEEGTWTPTARNDGSFTNAIGKYIKIGRQVTVWGFLPTVTNITSNNLLQVSGLPYSASNDGNQLNDYVGPLMIRFVASTSLSGVSFNTYLGAARDYLEFFACRDDGNNYEAVKHSDLGFTNSNGIRFSISYFTA